MPLRRFTLALGLLATLAAPSAFAQAGHDHAHHQHATPDSTADSAFAALQARGRTAMGVDQYTSTHRFDDLADGGRIALQRDPADTAGVQTIRAHLKAIAAAFTAGDFSTPAFVHARGVPGTDLMAAKRTVIRYEFRPLPGGGEVRITTRDAEALRAVHAFLAFQRGDHRAGGSTTSEPDRSPPANPHAH